MTKEEAITALGDRNNLLWGMSKEEKKYYSEALDMAISALKGEWIPVSERLPEESGRYLTYIVNEYDEELQYIMTADYIARPKPIEGISPWFPDDECASDNVVAWQPLPEPYKAEKGGE